MANIRYIKGDATQPIGDGKKLIIHICNDLGLWGKGFVVPLGKKYPKAKRNYLKWFKDTKGRLNLGSVQVVHCGNICVANLIGQYDIRKQNNKAPIRYEAVQIGLNRLAKWLRKQEDTFSIHMPRIGCGLAGGVWNKIEPIIIEAFNNEEINITVYDL